MSATLDAGKYASFFPGAKIGLVQVSFNFLVNSMIFAWYGPAGQQLSLEREHACDRLTAC